MTPDRMEILTSRVFDTTVGRLYGCFADAAILPLWWGPDDFTNTISRFDLVPGGEWHVTMHNSGEDFHNRFTFQEIVPGERIVMLHHEPIHVFTLEMTFSPSSDGARLVWRMHFDRNAENLALKKFIAAANEQNFDRLAAVLAAPDGDR